MEILSQASAKKKRKGLRVWNFALLWAVFESHGSEGVKTNNKRKKGTGAIVDNQDSKSKTGWNIQLKKEDFRVKI